MHSPIPSHLRRFAPVLILLAILGICTSTAALARNPYDLADQNEGDPGDGVLDPAVASDPNVAGSKIPLPVFRATRPRDDGSPMSPQNAFCLVPLPFSGGLPGQGIVLVLPRAWLRPSAPTLLRNGRWHDAP